MIVKITNSQEQKPKLADILFPQLHKDNNSI